MAWFLMSYQGVTKVGWTMKMLWRASWEKVLGVKRGVILAKRNFDSIDVRNIKFAVRLVLKKVFGFIQFKRKFFFQLQCGFVSECFGRFQEAGSRDFMAYCCAHVWRVEYARIGG